MQPRREITTRKSSKHRGSLAGERLHSTQDKAHADRRITMRAVRALRHRGSATIRTGIPAGLRPRLANKRSPALIRRPRIRWQTSGQVAAGFAGLDFVVDFVVLDLAFGAGFRDAAGLILIGLPAGPAAAGSGSGRKNRRHS